MTDEQQHDRCPHCYSYNLTYHPHSWFACWEVKCEDCGAEGNSPHEPIVKLPPLQNAESVDNGE